MDSRLDQWNIDSGIIMQIVLAADMNTSIVWADRTHTGKIVLANKPYCLYTHRSIGYLLVVTIPVAYRPVVIIPVVYSLVVVNW